MRGGLVVEGARRAASVLAPAQSGETAVAPPVVNTASYRDGHTRPRALAFNPDDGLLYAALSTGDEVAVVDPAAAPPRVLARKQVCRFPGRARGAAGRRRARRAAASIQACARVRAGRTRRLARDGAGGRDR